MPPIGFVLFIFTYPIVSFQVDLIGFDCEWLNLENGSPARLSLIQIATRQKVYLLDALAIGQLLGGPLGKLLANVFTNGKVLKLGNY